MASAQLAEVEVPTAPIQQRRLGVVVLVAFALVQLVYAFVIWQAQVDPRVGSVWFVTGAGLTLAFARWSWSRGLFVVAGAVGVAGWIMGAFRSVAMIASVGSFSSYSQLDWWRLSAAISFALLGILWWAAWRSYIKPWHLHEWARRHVRR
jgi:hypothetical protein